MSIPSREEARPIEVLDRMEAWLRGGGRIPSLIPKVDPDHLPPGFQVAYTGAEFGRICREIRAAGGSPIDTLAEDTAGRYVWLIAEDVYIPRGLGAT